MKKHLSILTAGLISITSCQEPTLNQPALNETFSFSEEAETEAIMKVIDNETKCFFDGDYECWASNWSHQNYAMQAWNNSDGSSDAAIGWEKINSQGKGWIEKYYKNGENVIHPDVKRKKPLVKFFNEKSAYLNWEQYNADSDKKHYRVSYEIRIMEKESDGWKIVNVSAFWDAEPKILTDSLKIE
ncbi:MAG: hypothetical protein IPL46_30155 [Saprospiraceae bacterium]|nr:hypothetical protein [Saprospiraceae bacterium]